MKSHAAFEFLYGPVPGAPVFPAPTCTIRMTIDAGSVTTLRRLAMRLCGDAFEFMRIAACAGGARSRVWLCVQRSCADLLSASIERQFPGARIGSTLSQGGAS